MTPAYFLTGFDMGENGVIIAKLSIIEDYMVKLKKYLPITLEQLKADWGLQKIIERSLQVMIEVMIDIAERIIAYNNMIPGDTSANSLKKIEELGVISDSEKYIKMIRFRNLIVHKYDTIDYDIIYSIVSNNLEDFTQFVQEIRAYENF